MLYLDTGAQFSECGEYRYALWRVWDNLQNGHCVFIGLNPSTANATEDDPTIRRCVDFAKRFNYSGLYMLNIFAYRATIPHKLYVVKNPIGDENNKFIKMYCEAAEGYIIACWGNHGKLLQRGKEVLDLLEYFNLKAKCFGLTGEKHPKHPLYLSKETKLINI